LAIVINNGAFGTQAAKRRATSTQIGDIRCRLGVVLDRAGGSEQLVQFNQGRRGAATLFRHALEESVFVAKAQRADPARIIHGQEIIKCVERFVVCRFVTTPHLGGVWRDHVR